MIVPCGGTKQPTRDRAPAAEMYTGSYHQATRRAAEPLAPEEVLILSAQYGLLDLHTEIPRYDLCMGRNGSITPTRYGGRPVAAACSVRRSPY